jgi:hypothetical protein
MVIRPMRLQTHPKKGKQVDIKILFVLQHAQIKIITELNLLDMNKKHIITSSFQISSSTLASCTKEVTNTAQMGKQQYKLYLRISLCLINKCDPSIEV